jgi:hypothetical protein
LAILLPLGSESSAAAQVQGFAVERLYQSAPEGGWFVMDDLAMHGGLGGAMALSTGYAQDPLRVSEGGQHLSVVSNQAFLDFAFAVTYDRLRLYFDFSSPLAIHGQSGTIGGYAFAGPSNPGPPIADRIDLGTNPDTIADPRIGVDIRLLGSPEGPFRLGAGMQLLVPSGDTSAVTSAPAVAYVTDGTYRAMGRVLVAGDLGWFTYAGQLGFHLRPLDEAPAPDSPQGSELVFGAAGGARFPVCGGSSRIVVGPEVFGETAVRSPFGSRATGLEGLLTGRFEGTGDDGPQLRVKVGAGIGIVPDFGAPEWRVVAGIEVFDHNSDRDNDGVTDGNDACPDVAGPKTKDPKTNGCPPPAKE